MNTNLSQKIREEMKKSFSKIYKDLRADYETSFEKARGFKFSNDPHAIIKYTMSDPWTYLFAAPIHSIGERHDEHVSDPEQPADVEWDAEELTMPHEPKLTVHLSQNHLLSDAVMR